MQDFSCFNRLFVNCSQPTVELPSRLALRQLPRGKYFKIRHSSRCTFLWLRAELRPNDFAQKLWLGAVFPQIFQSSNAYFKTEMVMWTPPLCHSVSVLGHLGAKMGPLHSLRLWFAVPRHSAIWVWLQEDQSPGWVSNSPPSSRVVNKHEEMKTQLFQRCDRALSSEGLW